MTSDLCNKYEHITTPNILSVLEKNRNVIHLGFLPLNSMSKTSVFYCNQKILFVFQKGCP